MKKNAKQATPKRSLQQFAQAIRGKDCAVCQLPPTILRQIAARNHRTVPLSVVIEWLKEQGYALTEKQFMYHVRQKHGRIRR